MKPLDISDKTSGQFRAVFVAIKPGVLSQNMILTQAEGFMWVTLTRN